MSELPYEFRQPLAPDGGLAVELYAEGERVAIGSVGSRTLHEMKTLLGVGEEEVRALLEGSLVEHLRQQHRTVELTPPGPITPRADCLASRYVVRTGGQVSAGVVWYDPSQGATGPADAPVAARNKLRFEVRRRLAEARRTPLKRALERAIDVLHAMSE